jgi:hypothetical protein
MKLHPNDYDRKMESVVLSQTLKNAVPNTLFYGAIAGATLWLGGYWPLVGKIVCIVYGILLVTEAVRHTVSLVSTSIACIGRPSSGDTKMLIAVVVQILETAVFAFFFWLLLRRFFLS